MKKASILTALLFVLAIVACKKDDNNIDDPVTQPETGITFTCKDSVRLSDILVGIAPLQSDADSGVFLKSGLSDGFGQVEFIGLDPQTFYYRASRSTTSGTIRRYGSVLVEKDKKTLVNVQF